MSGRQDEPIQEDANNALSRSQHPFNLAMIVGIVVLVALIIAGGVFSINRLTSVGGILGPMPTPTAIPGSNQFYFYESPPWGSISVDGHVLAPVPALGSSLPPLQLSPGIHQVVWSADPFTPVHCLIFLPFQLSSESCVGSNALLALPGPDARTVEAYLISFSIALPDLSVAQFNTLTQAIQAALDRLQGSEIVQPGEYFAHTHITYTHVSTSIDAATTPLHAILNFQSIVSFNRDESGGLCISGGLIDQPNDCTNNGQGCFNLCTLTEPAAKMPVKQWDVLVPITPTWRYVASNGQVVLQDQADPEEENSGLTAFLVALSLSWDGSQWQVTLYHSTSVDQSAIGNPACDAAQYIIGQDSTFSSIAGSSQTLSWKYVSDTNSASGCLAEAFPVSDSTGTPTSATSKPLARCLYRFGVLLALDDVAHRSWPGLPIASTYEQNIAQLISMQAHNS